MDSYAESIVIVTHLDFIAKEYAKQLIKYSMNKKIPYLNIFTNFGTIKLYEKLGFETRKAISFWYFIVK